MVLNKAWGQRGLAPQHASDELGAQFALKRTFINLATVCLTLAGLVTIAPSASSQSVERSTLQATVQHSTCAIDPQGLMCNASSHEVDKTLVPSQASTNAATALQPLDNAQMEQLSDVLLGLLYFVLPVGFGLGLFLHDRHQAYRTAMLDAQIKLLEKLWEQTPQA